MEEASIRQSGQVASLEGPRLATCFGTGRLPAGNHWVFVILSPRAGGLSLGVNLNPLRRCNFDCVHCEVDRKSGPRAGSVDLEGMERELVRMLDCLEHGRLGDCPELKVVPPELLGLRHVTLSGEGEPTTNPQFPEILRAVVHVRACRQEPFFKFVLLTNGSLLDQANVRSGIKYLIDRDEIWVKLDAGSESAYERLNRTDIPYRRVLDNILKLGRQRPVVLQGVFLRVDGREPAEGEVVEYAARLVWLRKEGAQISRVVIGSGIATDGTARHLPLRSLSRIARLLRQETDLLVDVL